MCQKNCFRNAQELNSQLYIHWYVIAWNNFGVIERNAQIMFQELQFNHFTLENELARE